MVSFHTNNSYIFIWCNVFQFITNNLHSYMVSCIPISYKWLGHSNLVERIFSDNNNCQTNLLNPEMGPNQVLQLQITVNLGVIITKEYSPELQSWSLTTRCSLMSYPGQKYGIKYSSPVVWGGTLIAFLQKGKTPPTSVLDITVNHLIARLQPRRFEECEVHHNCHCSQVHSDPDW